MSRIYLERLVQFVSTFCFPHYFVQCQLVAGASAWFHYAWFTLPRSNEFIRSDLVCWTSIRTNKFVTTWMVFSILRPLSYPVRQLCCACSIRHRETREDPGALQNW